MRWRSSRLIWRCWSLPSCPRPRCAGESTAAKARNKAKRARSMMGEMLRGLPCGRLSFCNNLLPMPELKTRILIVDDDQRHRDLLVKYLGGEGYDVKAVPDATGMDKQLARERYDLVVLDLMLPGEDGLAICRRLRASPAAPAIVMLTAKGDDVDRIVGLEMGADDYLPKPFNPRELLARINAVLRRKVPLGPPGAPVEGGSFQFGAFSLNLSTRTLTRGGKQVALTTGEFSVLQVLVRHPRQPL